jgi:uncharacterized RDD family membrane protein YckC
MAAAVGGADFLGGRWLVPYLMTLIPFAGLVLALLDVLFIFRDDQRCLHDLLADTKVVVEMR